MDFTNVVKHPQNKAATQKQISECMDCSLPSKIGFKPKGRQFFWKSRKASKIFWMDCMLQLLNYFIHLCGNEFSREIKSRPGTRLVGNCFQSCLLKSMLKISSNCWRFDITHVWNTIPIIRMRLCRPVKFIYYLLNNKDKHWKKKLQNYNNVNCESGNQKHIMNTFNDSGMYCIE